MIPSLGSGAPSVAANSTYTGEAVFMVILLTIIQGLIIGSVVWRTST
jgi:hypothetical protein